MTRSAPPPRRPPPRAKPAGETVRAFIRTLEKLDASRRRPEDKR